MAQASNPQFHSTEQSRIEEPTRVRAGAKIAVLSSQAEPYDKTAGPALMEVHLSETFVGDIEGYSPVRALQILRDDKSASLVSMQRFHGKRGGRQGTFVLGRKSSRTAISRRDGLSFPDRERTNFPGCVARAALKAASAKGPTQRWTIDSNGRAPLLRRRGRELIN